MSASRELGYCRRRVGFPFQTIGSGCKTWLRPEDEITTTLNACYTAQLWKIGLFTSCVDLRINVSAIRRKSYPVLDTPDERSNQSDILALADRKAGEIEHPSAASLTAVTGPHDVDLLE